MTDADRSVVTLSRVTLVCNAVILRRVTGVGHVHQVSRVMALETDAGHCAAQKDLATPVYDVMTHQMDLAAAHALLG